MIMFRPKLTLLNDKISENQEDMKNKVIKYPETIIGANTSIGAGAVILPGIKIGENVAIAGSAIVTKDVYHPNSLVIEENLKL